MFAASNKIDLASGPIIKLRSTLHDAFPCQRQLLQVISKEVHHEVTNVLAGVPEPIASIAKPIRGIASDKIRNVFPGTSSPITGITNSTFDPITCGLRSSWRPIADGIRSVSGSIPDGLT